ncbi:MAG: hypothetical protein U0K27_00345 [Segatella copri]|jgi:hypothetical protein|nr:hypothetical protein [Prevotella sp.]MED9981546.1 hypothetical protein [Segatella copri]
MKPTIIGAVVYSERKFPTLFPEDHNNSQCFFLLKCLEAAPAESMRKGTKKLAKNKKKWDLFSFLLQISKI